MAFSLLLLFFIYYPLINLYFFPNKPDKKILRSDFYIEISKINVLAKIIENVDPFNETLYRKALEEGVAQAKGTSLPNGSSTMFLFAHSSDLPWRITRYNIAFFRLPELKKDDIITVVRKGKIYTYKVREEKTVWPNEINYLLDTTRKQLVLQTCVPIGSSFQRLLVFADPQ